MSESLSSSAFGWKRTLVFVWGGEFASVLTSSVLQMGLIWHVTLSAQSASALALITLAAFLPMALLPARSSTASRSSAHSSEPICSLLR